MKITIRPIENKHEINFEKKNLDLSTIYSDKKPVLFSWGKAAIEAVLENLNLKQDDEIYIDTTFNTTYVSSCVTTRIFKYCKPSRTLSEKTKAIFVIHELGVPNEKINELMKTAKEKNIPLIEDCACSIDSRYKDGSRVGSKGDYTVFSIWKKMPSEFGGILFTKEAIESDLSVKELEILSGVVRDHLPLLSSYSSKRRENANLLLKQLSAENIEPYFDIDENISPYQILIKITNPNKIARILNNSGIEAGVYWGSNAIIIPIHQYISESEIEFISTKILEANNECNNHSQ
jgi:hypothetical protein